MPGRPRLRGALPAAHAGPRTDEGQRGVAKVDAHDAQRAVALAQLHLVPRQYALQAAGSGGSSGRTLERETRVCKEPPAATGRRWWLAEQLSQLRPIDRALPHHHPAHSFKQNSGGRASEGALLLLPSVRTYPRYEPHCLTGWSRQSGAAPPAGKEEAGRQSDPTALTQPGHQGTGVGCARWRSQAVQCTAREAPSASLCDPAGMRQGPAPSSPGRPRPAGSVRRACRRRGRRRTAPPTPPAPPPLQARVVGRQAAQGDTLPREGSQAGARMAGHMG